MSLVLGLPAEAKEFSGIDQIGEACRIAADVTVLRHGVREGNLLSLGNFVTLFDGVRLVVGDISINLESLIQIGSKSIVNVGCYLSGEGGLVIGEEVLIGPHVKIFSAGHAIHGGEPSIFRNALTYARVKIEDGAWIGGGATILPGVTIGRGAVVGAGSVVTKDVLAFSIVGGNPAVNIKFRDGFETPGILDRIRKWWK